MRAMKVLAVCAVVQDANRRRLAYTAGLAVTCARLADLAAISETLKADLKTHHDAGPVKGVYGSRVHFLRSLMR